MTLLALCVMSVVSAAPASASGLHSLQVVSKSRVNELAVTASCPAGKRLLGTGGEVVDKAGVMHLRAIVPNDQLTRVTVRATGIGVVSQWRVTAWAICGLGATGLERVPASTDDDAPAKAVTASCPSGKRLLGAGAEVSDAWGLVMNSIVPNAALTGVHVHADDEWESADPWSLKAHAICANSTVANLQRVAFSLNNPDSNTGWPSVAFCPAGTRVLGGGARVGGDGRIGINRFQPHGDGVLVGALELQGGTEASWSVTAYGICVSMPSVGQP